MTNKHSRSQPKPNDASRSEPCALNASDETHVVVLRPRTQRTSDRYDLEQLFVEWASFAGVPGGWDATVRVLAHTLRGLYGAGLIERRTIRRPGHPTHHGFVLTDLGREALHALSGEWIEETR